MFGQFKILAGDFKTGNNHQFFADCLMLYPQGSWLRTVKYTRDQIVSVEQVTEDTQRKAGGTVGWGVAGALVAGPLGAIAAGYLGGKKDEVTFVCQLSDGKQFVGIMKKGMYVKLSAPFLLKPDPRS